MKIDNKFAELCHFIENPKDYELLYYAEDDIHNEYALDLEEAKRIISTIENLQKENQELRKQLEKYKKKLMIATKMEINEIDKNTFVGMDYFQDKCINYETQQKEFIKYLEDMLDNENDIFSVVRVKDVLQKYKEMIGDDKQ